MADQFKSADEDFDTEIYLATKRTLMADNDVSTPSNSSSFQEEVFMDNFEHLSFETDTIDVRGNRAILKNFKRVNRQGVLTDFRKDFYRSQHIRGLKKSIRQHASNKFPAASIHKIDPSNSTLYNMWCKLRIFYQKNKDALDSISLTTVGPASDGRTIRGDQPADEKTHNDSFIARFFSSQIVRIYNFLFTELVFAVSPDKMCEKMHLRCCDECPHTESCWQRWEELKRWTQVDMIVEVGLVIDVTEEHAYYSLLQ